MEGVRLRIRRTRPDDESELRDVVTSRREVVAGFRTLARDTAAHPGLIAHWFGLGAESAQADVRWAKACKSALAEIGRASCRERVCQYVSIWVVAVSLKKKR